jgi:ubiquinone/menaquinone biosynthesis C-methylase UbiE
MLSKETLPSLNKREVAIDVATGTGFLAKHFSSIFTRAIGTDLSESQIKQASESHKDVQNLQFKILDVKNLSEFLVQEKLDQN